MSYQTKINSSTVDIRRQFPGNGRAPGLLPLFHLKLFNVKKVEHFIFLGNCTRPVNNDKVGEKLIKLIFVQF